ncbi:MAG: ribosome-recycling factor, partial [Woeseiaceae bacterium]|nr:ribosome-recycling factor [Woeseiaceae bacterium]MDX2607724.1 ribosome-recycling factor [Woeseiaceae bacterium]
RVPLPALTEERRKDMIRIVRHEAEGGRIAIRNIRRDALGDAKDLLKEKMMGEDDEPRAHDERQAITDKYVAEIDKVLAEKESELLEISDFPGGFPLFINGNERPHSRARRHYHGWQWPLGQKTGFAASRRASIRGWLGTPGG